MPKYTDSKAAKQNNYITYIVYMYIRVHEEKKLFVFRTEIRPAFGTLVILRAFCVAFVHESKSKVIFPSYKVVRSYN